MDNQFGRRKASVNPLQNAEIEYTTLGIEDHGIMNFWLGLKFDGTGQGFGGWALDGPSPTGDWKEPRCGSAASIALLRRILEVVGVSDWEKLKGKHLRADAEHSKIHGIWNLLTKDNVYPQDFFEQHP